MTGAFFRVKRYGKWETIELEYLTSDERSNLLKDRDNVFILSCLDLACNKLREYGQLSDQLMQDNMELI